MSPENTVDMVLKFLAALVIPVVIAAPVIAFVIDQFLKKLPGWTSQRTVQANVVLNLLVSGIFFFANTFGMTAQFQESVEIAGKLLPLIVLIMYGTIVQSGATWAFHKGYQTTGVASSTTNNSPGLLGTPSK